MRGFERVEVGLAATERDDFGAALGERPRYRHADALAGAGHERTLTVETHEGSLSIWFCMRDRCRRALPGQDAIRRWSQAGSITKSRCGSE